jgi:crotonobetainyl-CoA:carnitine CoA-transferase CaiB-like acyl-CoA transferase
LDAWSHDAEHRLNTTLKPAAGEVTDLNDIGMRCFCALQHGDPVLLTQTRVVEWAEGLSAPFTARLLADLGADVVKVEPPGGDQLRRRGPFWPGETGADASALFGYVNAGKRSVTLDLASQAAAFDALLADAAILIESQSAATLQRYGISIEALQARYPALVVLSLTPFGRTGPLQNAPATDFTLQHRAAFAYNMARPVDDPAARGPLAGADHEGPLAVGVAGALAAVWGLLVAAGGKAPHIDLASHDFYAHIAFEGLADWSTGERTFTRRRVKREGTEAAGGLTWILPCAGGGWVMVSPREQHQWDRWVELLGRPAWSADAALCGTRVERRRNWFALQEVMTEWSKGLSPDEVTQRAQAVAVACFPISTPDALLRNAQLQHRQFFDRLVSPSGAQARVPGLPIHLQTTGHGALPHDRALHSPTLETA